MKFGIDWKQPSTQRGAIWLITAAIGLVCLYLDKPISELLLLAAAINGGLGLAVKD